MKRGDLVKHLGDWAVGKLVIGVIVELDEEGLDGQAVVYYAGLTNVMSDEEKYHWMWKDQIEVICEAG